MRLPAAASSVVLAAALTACATPHPTMLGELADGPLTRRGVLHPVQKGQTLWRIAHAYRVSVQEVAEVNDLTDPTRIQAGQALWIPGADHILDVPPAGVAAPAPKVHHAEHTSTTAVKEGARENVKESVKPAAREADPPENPDEETPLEVRHSRFIWPVKGVIGSRFGVRDGTQHDGIDIDAPKGTPILAADAGDVLYAGEQRGYGNLVLVRHADNLITVYAHNDENRVKAGEHVRKGAVLAIVGQTGRATGPHLHFEVRQDRLPRNPLFFLP